MNAPRSDIRRIVPLFSACAFVLASGFVARILEAPPAIFIILLCTVVPLVIWFEFILKQGSFTSTDRSRARNLIYAPALLLIYIPYYMLSSLPVPPWLTLPFVALTVVLTIWYLKTDETDK